MSLPLVNTAPARTGATRRGALTARHRVCADSMSLNAIATPAAREPGPLPLPRIFGRYLALIDPGDVTRGWSVTYTGLTTRWEASPWPIAATPSTIVSRPYARSAACAALMRGSDWRESDESGGVLSDESCAV